MWWQPKRSFGQKTVGRMPLPTIQSLLELLYGVHLSRGELSEMLHTVARRGQEASPQLRGEVRQSAYVHGDETGWRQDGENGYGWSFSTPTVRYFLYQKSRGSGVVEAVLGEEYDGMVVRDFYSAYGVPLGRHQRCWVHRLRELRALKEAHPEDAGGKRLWGRCGHSTGGRRHSRARAPRAGGNNG